MFEFTILPVSGHFAIYPEWFPLSLFLSLDAMILYQHLSFGLIIKLISKLDCIFFLKRWMYGWCTEKMFLYCIYTVCTVSWGSRWRRWGRKMVFLMKKCNSMHSIFAEKDMTKVLLFVCQTEMHLAGQKTR